MQASSKIEITGHVKPLIRLRTKLHSFDNAFINTKGEIGFPLGKMAEIYGVTHCGKSTMVYGLAGIIAKNLSGNIALVDLEDFDPEFLTTILSTVGFEGRVYSILEPDDEKTLTTLINVMWDDEQNLSVGIVDSVGAISPISERVGDVGEAIMGRRAKMIAAFSRKAVHLLRAHDAPKSIFLINHQHPRIGGFGIITPGGETKNYLSSIILHVKRARLKNKEQTYPDGSYVMVGNVKKNKWGLKDNTFYLFMLSGKGVHIGLTALYDCLVEGHATISRNVISLGKTPYGRLRTIIESAHANDNDFFVPFINALSQENVL